MGLFRNEGPNLGPGTTVFELSGYGAGNPVQNNYKPTTREIITVPLTIGATSQYVYQAPWSCQVIGIHYNCTTAAGATNLSIERIIGDSVAPAAANGTTIILLSTGVLALAGFAANTRQNIALSVAAGSPLVLNAGDQIALFFSSALATAVGAYVQIELTQIG